MLDRLAINDADVAGKQIGQFCRLWRKTGRVDHHAGMRNRRQILQLLGLVPDNIEISDDALQQIPGWLAASPMLKRRKIGRRNA